MPLALCLQHVPFEGPGVFADALRARGYTIETCLVPEQGLPRDDFDFLLIMGGPMSVNDSAPWIEEETAFIRRAILGGHCPILGICLGSQFMAKALGGTVAPAPAPEIGMTNITLTAAGRNDPCFAASPETFAALAWHGEGIVPPPGATVLAGSDAFPIQAFRYGNQAYGLLFHLEMDEDGVATLCRECPADLAAAGLTGEQVRQGFQGGMEPLRPLARAVIDALP